MSDDREPTAEDRTAERWAWIAWGGLVAVAVAVFEVFQQPALLGGTLGLKFAWADARTGWWLWGRDPDRRRGRSNFWVYLGYGLWKAAAVGIVLSFALVGILANFGAPPRNPQNGRPANDVMTLFFAGTCLSGMFASLLAAGVTFYGVASAYRGRRKLWVSSALAAARVRDHWPPDYGTDNRLGRIALPSALIVVTLALAAVTVGVMLAIDEVVGVQKTVAGLFSTAALFAVPVLGLTLNDLVKQRLTALTPQEAWPDEPDDRDEGA